MKEVRTIIFSNEEVQVALTEHCRRRGKQLPAGVVTGFSFTADPLSVCLAVTDDRGRRTALEFGAIELAAALIGFCLYRKVPLPVRADKQIQIIGSAFVLVVTMLGKRTEDKPTADQRRVITQEAVLSTRR